MTPSWFITEAYAQGCITKWDDMKLYANPSSEDHVAIFCKDHHDMGRQNIQAIGFDSIVQKSGSKKTKKKQAKPVEEVIDDEYESDEPKPAPKPARKPAKKPKKKVLLSKNLVNQ